MRAKLSADSESGLSGFAVCHGAGRETGIRSIRAHNPLTAQFALIPPILSVPPFPCIL